MTIGAQILRGLLKLKKLKQASTILGIQKSTKDKNVKENVIKNMSSALKSVGRSRKKIDLDESREIQITMVSSTTQIYHLIKYMEEALGTSLKHCTSTRNFD